MFSLLLIILFAIPTSPQKPIPDKASICKNPIFDAALVVTDWDANGYPIYKRYLFQGQYVLPYLREPKPTIDWNNIKLITDIFHGVSQISVKDNGLWTAFEAENRVYMAFHKSENIYVLDKTNNFPLIDTISDWEDFGYQFIKWSVEVISESGDKSKRKYVFVDSEAKIVNTTLNITTMPFRMSLSSNNFFEFEFTNEAKLEKKIAFYKYVSPIIFGFKDNRIPTEFDAYYQTKSLETIFFREDFACVSLLWSPARWHESDYCRSFVDTRTIIGCIPDVTPPIDSIPETDPNEPDIDVEPNV